MIGGADKNLTFLDFKNLNTKPDQLQLSEGVMDVLIVKDIVICGLRDGNVVFIDSDTR